MLNWETHKVGQSDLFWVLHLVEKQTSKFLVSTVPRITVLTCSKLWGTFTSKVCACLCLGCTRMQFEPSTWHFTPKGTPSTRKHQRLVARDFRMGSQKRFCRFSHYPTVLFLDWKFTKDAEEAGEQFEKQENLLLRGREESSLIHR